MDHDWLEGGGEPVRYLVRLIDDATSRSWGRFVQHDGTRENMPAVYGPSDRDPANTLFLLDCGRYGISANS